MLFSYESRLADALRLGPWRVKSNFMVTDIERTARSAQSIRPHPARTQPMRNAATLANKK
jgi:hypothetical protein